MSTSHDTATTPPSFGDESPDISDTESGSSYAGSAAPDTPVCPYQNAEFFGHECTRYHDCPTHLVERDNVEDNAVSDDAVGASSQSPRHEVMGPALDSSDEVGASTESNPEHNRVDTSIPEQSLPLDTQSSQPEDDRSSSERTSSAPVATIPRIEPGSAPHEQVTTPNEAIDHFTESLHELSLRDEAQTNPVPDASSSSLGERDQNVAPMTPPETRRPTSSLTPIASSFSPRAERRSPPEITLPRWQPDSEVTYCPICHTQFSFFIRKHHCRKCGRVVCNSCSPHKITIPHQYIVRPPGERAFQRYSFLGEEGGISDFSALGGGEQVRLCNPCVPDPNTTPPQTQHSAGQFSPRSTHQRTQSSSSNYGGDSAIPRYAPMVVSSNMPPDAHSRSRSVTMSPTSSRPPNSTYFPHQNRIMAGTPPTYYPHPYSGYRHPSLLGPRFPGASLIDLAGPSSSSSSAAAMNRPLPPPPQIPEEDECPVCHRELPSRELPNFEARRESHISSCIMAHSTYSPGPDASGRPGNHGPVQPRPARRTGMFPYLATEKDCVDSAECTICLEEFEVGVPMARLECLCRFHRSCITAWFVDHPGRCPVHQHDSFGY